MQEIARLISVLDSIGNKSNLLNKINRNGSLESDLIKGIYLKKYTTDKEAANSLYGTDQSDVRYKMLKHRIKKKLYYQLLNLDINDDETALQKEQECLRLFNLSKLLLKGLQYDLVLKLSNKMKSVANSYDFNEIVLKSYEIDSVCFMSKGLHKQFHLAKAKESEFQNIVNLEREAVSLYHKTKLYLKITVKNRKEFLKELPHILERLRNIWETTKSFESYNAFFKTSILSNELNGNFGEIIRITEEANEFISKGKLNKLRFDLRYNAFILVYAHLRHKSFENGLKYAEKFVPFFDEATSNWFSYMENYFLMALHAKQYELAGLILSKVQSNSYYKEIRKDAKERWQLYSAYLYFFKPMLTYQESFNYQKFASSFSSYSKDKQGFNVAIQVLQFIHFLKKNDSEALLYRIESLKKYSSTHLKDPSSLRSRLFLKLLMLTVTEDFDAESSRIKGAKNYQKLSETPTPGDAYAEIEIIPYEHLWEMVLEILEKRY